MKGRIVPAVKTRFSDGAASCQKSAGGLYSWKIVPTAAWANLYLEVGSRDYFRSAISAIRYVPFSMIGNRLRSTQHATATAASRVSQRRSRMVKRMGLIAGQISIACLIPRHVRPELSWIEMRIKVWGQLIDSIGQPAPIHPPRHAERHNHRQPKQVADDEFHGRPFRAVSAFERQLFHSFRTMA